MVTHLAPDRTLTVTTPAGLERIQPRALVLATGARERPRTARMIAGDRPAGVYTTGHLQNLVHLQHRAPGKRAVVVGGELVSWSAVLTLREAGCETVLMTTAYDRPESYAAFRAFGRGILRVPVAPRSKVVAIEGKHRVEAVQVQDLATGAVRRVECDTVVLTGDWIPDNELARIAGLELDRGSLGPEVDTALRTSASGVFAIGNLVHPVDTADIAALDGRHVAETVRRWLDTGNATEKGIRLSVEPPLRWISPSYLRPGDPQPPRGRLLTWCDEPVRAPRIEVRQGERVVTRQRVPWPAAPGRTFRVPARLLSGVDPHGADVTLRLS
jgi:NADPH-dependent 2,4-dienoyl-CoA reductase/sulfur reductase-like enzyme